MITSVCNMYCVDPDIPAPSVSNLNIHAPHLEKLWVYSCSITKRRNVTCLAWNPSNKVSYSDAYTVNREIFVVKKSSSDRPADED